MLLTKTRVTYELCICIMGLEGHKGDFAQSQQAQAKEDFLMQQIGAVAAGYIRNMQGSFV